MAGISQPLKTALISSALFFLTGSFIFLYGQEPAKPLTLSQCILIALNESPHAVRISGDYLQPRYTALSSLSSVLPNVQFSSGYAKSNGEQIDTFGTQTLLTDNDQFDLSFSVTQSIIDVSSWVQLKQAYSAADAAEIAYRGAKADLAFNVKQLFYDLVRSYHNVAVTISSVNQSVEQVYVAEERFRLGSMSRPELLQVQVGLSQLRVELITTASTVENEKRNLANYLGVSYPVQIDTSLQFPDTSMPLPSEDSLLSLALKKNPSYISSKINYDIQKGNEFAIKLQKVPTLSGSYSYGYSSSNPFSNWSENDFWTFGIQATIPIFEGLRWYGQLKEAQTQTNTLKAELEIAQNTASEEMHQAFTNLKSARQSLSIVSTLLQQANENFNLRKEQYRLGAVSSLELLTSQVSFNEAQQQAVQIITGYYLTYAQILRLLGEW